MVTATPQARNAAPPAGRAAIRRPGIRVRAARRLRRVSTFNLVVSLALLAPIAVVIGVSFNPEPYSVFPPQGFSLKWFSAALSDSSFRTSFVLSIEIGVVVTLVTLALALPTSMALLKAHPRMSRLLAGTLIGPLAIPEIMLALGLLVLFGQRFHVGVGFLPIVLGQTVVGVPLAVQILAGAMISADTSLEEAARTLGAGPWRVLRHVTIPMLAPAMLGAALFVFIFSFDNINISLFLASPGNVTLPIQMFQYLTYRADPTVAAMSTLLVAIGVAAFLLGARLGGVKYLSGGERR